MRSFTKCAQALRSVGPVCAERAISSLLLVILRGGAYFLVGDRKDGEMRVKRHPELPPHIASDENVTEADPRYSWIRLAASP